MILRAVAHDQPPAAEPPDGKADVVAEHGREPRAGQKRRQMQLVLGRKRGPRDQRGLAGQRQPERLEQQRTEYRGVAVAIQIGRNHTASVDQLAQPFWPGIDAGRDRAGAEPRAQRP